MNNDVKPSENLPVKRAEIDGVAVQWQDPFAFDDHIFSTFPDTWTNRKQLEAQAITEDATPGSTLVGHEFSIAHLAWHYVELHGREPGELVPAWRMVILSPDGERYSFVAMSIFKALRMLRRSHGDPPWEPALRVRLEMSKTKSGGNWYKLVDLTPLKGHQLPGPPGKRGK